MFSPSVSPVYLAFFALLLSRPVSVACFCPVLALGFLCFLSCCLFICLCPVLFSPSVSHVYCPVVCFFVSVMSCFWPVLLFIAHASCNLGIRVAHALSCSALGFQCLPGLRLLCFCLFVSLSLSCLCGLFFAYLPNVSVACVCSVLALCFQCFLSCVLHVSLLISCPVSCPVLALCFPCFLSCVLFVSFCSCRSYKGLYRSYVDVI
jgi:hypothetical protein